MPNARFIIGDEMPFFTPDNYLANRMFALADEQPSHALELRRIATELNELTHRYFSQNAPTDTREKLAGKWEEAKRIWAEATGEEF